MITFPGLLTSAASSRDWVDNLELYKIRQLKQPTAPTISVVFALFSGFIDVVDIESKEGLTIVYAHPNELFKIKEALKEIKSDIIFETDDIEFLPQSTIKVQGEDKEHFDKMLSMLRDQNFHSE